MDKDKMPIPVICFVGASGSGKTTIIEKVIRRLVDRRLRVATIKHTHKNFDIDKEGKDSWRHRMAGAKTVILSSPQRYAVVSEVDKEMGVEDFIERFIDINNIDLLIVEGFKQDIYPKIEVYREGISNELRCLKDRTIIALLTTSMDDPSVLSSLSIPVFDINDEEGIANFIEEFCHK